MYYLIPILSKVVETICQPNPNIIKDDAAKIVLLNRNKNVLFIQLFAFTLMTFYIYFTNRVPSPMQNISFLTIILITVIFIVTCRSYPIFFEIAYFAIVTLFGPCSLHFNKDSIFFNSIGVFILPTWMLFLSGRRSMFFIELFVQIIYMHVLYKPRLINILDEMSPEAYIQRVTNITTFGVIINCIFLFTTFTALTKAHHKIAFTISKKIELERQKIFLLGFSHELRNLINSLMGCIQLCALEPLSEKAREILQNAEVCGELLTHLITNILDTGKVEIGDLEINLFSRNIYDTLEKVWNVTSQLIKNKNLGGKMTIEKSLPKDLKFDNYRLTQILLNLIGNAVKSTDKGNVDIDVKWIEQSKITEECFEPRPFEDDGLFEKDRSVYVLRKDVDILDLKYTKKNSQNGANKTEFTRNGVLKIIVSDTGIGIPTEKLPTLFGRFQQINDDLDKNKLGTGIGLFVTKELIQRMNGKIEVYSRPNQGTVFVICLPIEVVERRAQPISNTDEFMTELKSLNLRALVVDDIQFNITILSNFLKKIGVQTIDIARNGKEAVEKFKQNAHTKPYNIITMDIEMPIMDGKQASRLIRQYEVEKNLSPCLLTIVSGNCSQTEIADCLDELAVNPADFFLKKPVAMHDLLSLLKSRFDNSFN